MFIDNYNSFPDITQEMDEREINYGYTRKRNYTEVKTLAFCPCCNKRITSGDEVWETESGVYCSERCEIKFLEDESA